VRDAGRFRGEFCSSTIGPAFLRNREEWTVSFTAARGFRSICATLMMGGLLCGAAATLPADETPLPATEPTGESPADEVEFLPFPPGVGPGSPDDDVIPVVPIPDEEPVADDLAALDDEGVSEDEEPADEVDAKDAPAKDTPDPADKAQPAPKKNGDEENGDGKKADAPAKAGDKPPAPNPLGKLFDKLFPPAAKPVPPPAAPKGQGVKPGQAKPVPGKQGEAPVVQPTLRKPKSRTVPDTRVAHDRRKLQWLSSAELSVQEGDWNEAVKWYQQILDNPDDALHRLDNGDWMSLKRFVRRELANAPTALREAYRTQYEGLARRMWDDATRRGDEAELARLAATYFPTEAAQAAANRVGTQALDRGEMVLAARWFDELWTTRSPLTRDRKWRLKALVALDRARLDSAKEVLVALAEPPGTPAAATSPAPRTPGTTEWLADLTARWPAWSAPVLTDWLVPFGDAGRTAVVEGGDPLLIPRWSSPLTDSHPVKEQVEHLVQSLQDQDHPTLPAAHALLVDGRIAFRTLAGVRVVEARTGRMLWQTDDGLPLEQAIAAAATASETGDFSAVQKLMGNPLFAENSFLHNQHGQAPENQPLAHLLFRNANFGSISSDGSQLFVLTDEGIFDPRQPGQTNAWEGRDPARGPGNLLQAYKLGSGQIAWEIGGAMSADGLELPLAGHFFFGPPVAIDGELLVVAEVAKDIRLCALDPADGRLLWSLLLGHADADIDTDLGRRWWSAPVAESQGILVCPTTTGWVMGVDRRSRSLLWGHRLTQPGKPGENGETADLVQMLPLNSTWAPSAPIIADGRVVLTTPESPNVVCLDLGTGRRLWQKSRNNSLQVAGIHDQLLVLTGPTEVTALRLANGESRWKAKTGQPAGRGVLVAGSLYLPLRSGEVRRLALDDGRTLGSWFPRESPLVLGNLSMYRGLLVSHGPLGLTAFEQEEAVRRDIARLREQDPHSVSAALSEARVAALKREQTRALELLEPIDDTKLVADDRALWRQLLFDALLETLRGAETTVDTTDRFARLLTLAATESEKRQVIDLRARREAQAGRYAEALSLYGSLLDAPAVELAIQDVDGQRKVSGDAWLAGRVAELWRAIPEDRRPELMATVQKFVAPASPDDPITEHHRRLRVWGVTPAGRDAALAFVDRVSNRGEFAAAERWLRPWLDDTDPAVAFRFRTRLARLYEQREMWSASARAWNRVATDSATATDEAGQTGEQLARAALERLAPNRIRPAPFDWEHSNTRVERIGVNYTNEYLQDFSALSREPYFRDFELSVSQQDQRLELVDDRTGELVWSQPLRSRLGAAENNLAVGDITGHVVVLLHRGVLHGISPVDRRVLWTHTADVRGQSHQYHTGHSPLHTPHMTATISLQHRLSVLQPGQGASQLSLVSTGIVIHHGPRAMRAVDTLTGEVLWTRPGPRAGTLVFGDEELLLLFHPESRRIVAVSGIDGQQVACPGVDGQSLNPWLFVGRRMLFSRAGDNRESKGTVLELFDPLQNRTVWSFPVPAKTQFGVIEPTRLALLGEKGELRELDLSTGRAVSLGDVPETDMKARSQAFTLVDDDTLFLIVNTQRSGNSMQEGGLPSVAMNGKVFAFNRSGGGPKWTQSIGNQYLIVERFRHNPLLVFASRRYEQRGMFGGNSIFEVQVLDKATGTRLLQDRNPSHGGFRSLLVDRARPAVEVRSYNERLRFVPGVQQAANSTPEAKPATP
jgi:outer membrane protein assembly factor BamB